MVKRTFAADGNAFMNPERGLYVSVDLLDESDNYATVRGRQSTLAYAGVTLAAFRCRHLAVCDGHEPVERARGFTDR